MSTVLLTGFEPFDGAAVNPSWLAVLRAKELWNGPDTIAVRELPVDFVTAGAVLADAVREIRPDVVIAVGQAGGRADLTIERVAINVDDARIPDNAGLAPIDDPIVADGPVGYFSSLPIKAVVAALVAEGVPASVSQTAGTFVCNNVFYRLMHLLATEPMPGARGGFVHVPFLPEQAAGTGQPSMSLDVIAAGLGLVARTSLTVSRDVRVSGGATH